MPGADHREQRHRLGEAVERVAPVAGPSAAASPRSACRHGRCRATRRNWWMANAQLTGMLRPQTPTPRVNSTVTETRNSSSSARLRSQRDQPARAASGKCSGMRATRSVTSRSDLVGRKRSARSLAIAVRPLASIAREVGRARPRAELFEQRVIALARPLRSRPRCLAVGDVAEHDRLGRAGLLAGGHDLAVADRPALDVGRAPCAPRCAGCSRCISPSRRGRAR